MNPVFSKAVAPKYLTVILNSVMFLSSLCSLPAYADQNIRPLTSADLPSAIADDFVKVKSARIAWVNYEAVRRDFAEVRDMNNGQIDSWIYKNFTYVSRRQLHLAKIRTTDIETDSNDVRKGLRPSSYERAAVFETPNGKLVDIKGVGLATDSRVEAQLDAFKNANGDSKAIDRLRTKDHSDGLMSLGESIAETTRQQAIQKSFAINNVETGAFNETTDSYWVVDLGFDILKDNGERIAAAQYARQTSFMRVKWFTPPAGIYLDIFGGRQHDGFNAAIDFGASIVIHPKLQINFGPIADNPTEADKTNPQRQKPWLWAHDTAAAFRRTGDRSIVDRHIHEMLEPINAEWLAIKDKSVALHKRNTAKRLGVSIKKMMTTISTAHNFLNVKAATDWMFFSDLGDVNDALNRVLENIRVWVPDETEFLGLAKYLKEDTYQWTSNNSFLVSSSFAQERRLAEYTKGLKFKIYLIDSGIPIDRNDECRRVEVDMISKSYPAVSSTQPAYSRNSDM